MAKKFGGFTPQQQHTLLSKMGYTGPAQQDDINKFMMSSPKAASMMGRYADMAKARVEGGPQMAMAVGGMTYDPATGLPTAPGEIPESIQGLEAAPEALSVANMNTRVGASTFKSSGHQVVLSDGTKSPLFRYGKSDADNERERKAAEDWAAAEIAKRNQQIEDYTTYQSTQDTYNQQLDQYKTYQAGEAGVTTGEGTRAALDTTQSDLAKEQSLLQNYAQELSGLAEDDPQRAIIQDLITEQKAKVATAQQGLSQAKSNVELVGMPSTTEMRADTLADPMSMVTQADVATFTEEERAAGKMAEGTGQAPATATQATQTTAAGSTNIGQAADIGTVTYDATMVTDKAKAELDKAKAAKGVLSKEALMEAAQGNLSEGAFAEAAKFDQDKLRLVDEGPELAVTKQQLAEAKGRDYEAITTEIAQSEGIAKAVAEQHQVQPEELPEVAQIRDDEMAQAEAITADGLAPDAIAVAAKLEKFSVDDGTLALAMEGEVNALATVEGQLSQLMKDFDDGTPAWAAGAMRAANAAMAARGLGASSMASAAILQAAMESALPIAQQDANTFAQMGMANLNNRQQVALANAAAQQGLSLANLNNEQQAALQNSANAFALQSQNLSNMQQTVIANAQIKASLQGQNLSNQQQTNLAVAARFAEASNQNLNNKQQTALQNNTSALQVNLANLDKKSQAYVTNAQLAASLQGQVLSNEQQVAISNAARYAAAADIEFNAQQQAVLHNSNLMQTIGLAELDAEMSAVLQNAAQVASMDITNLNNRQQAAVQNAKAFLEMDMANLNNEQEMAVFKAQATQQALLSDQAAENAAKQFNASSENQTNQFMANLNTQIKIANQEQKNKVSMFNASEANAISVANANAQNARDQYNASSAIVIEQANAQWEQTISTTENAAQNQANRDAAIASNGMTETTYNNMLQQERDALDYAWRSADNTLGRENAVIIAELQTQAEVDMARGSGTGKLLETATDFIFQKLS